MHISHQSDPILLGLENEIVDSVEVDVETSRCCTEKTCPLPGNINV